MQSIEQTENVSPTPASSNGIGDWPPSLLRLVLAAVVAAGLSFLVLKTLLPIFVVPLEIAIVPETAPNWVNERFEKASYEADGKNFAVGFGISGAILAVCCVGFSFGWKQFRAFSVAIVAACILSALGAFMSNWMFYNMRLNSGGSTKLMGFALDGMTQSIIGYALLWSSIGIGVGIGVGAVKGFLKSVISGVSGLIGGALASMVYVILTAQFSIGTTMNRVLPLGNINQAIWLLLFSIILAVCIALGSGEKRRKSST